MPLRDPSIVDRQRGNVILGHIRMGKLDANNRPQKHDMFRITTKNRELADSAALAYEGEVRWWDAKNRADSAWEVNTGTVALDVMLPPVQAVDQWWKFYNKSRECLRTCDGIRQQKVDAACVCPSDVEERVRLGRGNNPTACLPHTRLNVRLPWVKGLGAWTLVSTGLYTALELEEKADLLQAACDAGIALTARLQLEKVAGMKNGQPTLWVTPRLYILESFADLQSPELLASAGTLRLPPPPRALLALTAGSDGPKAPALEPGVEQSWPTVKQPPPPPKAPTAQGLADQAKAATCRAELRPIGDAAKRLGLDVEHVTIDGADEPLIDYVRHRWDELRGTSETSDGVPLPPEPPEDDNS